MRRTVTGGGSFELRRRATGGRVDLPDPQNIQEPLLWETGGSGQELPLGETGGPGKEPPLEVTRDRKHGER